MHERIQRNVEIIPWIGYIDKFHNGLTHINKLVKNAELKEAIPLNTE